MAWVRIDDQFSDHPKVMEVGPLAECLFVRGLTYAARYLTDGFVPVGHLRRMGDMDALEEAEKLVDAGLWETVDKGYQIHDYLDYQPSAAKVQSEREDARKRMQKARSGKGKANVSGRSEDVRANTTRSSDNPIPVPNPEVPDGTSDPPDPPTGQRRRTVNDSDTVLSGVQAERFDRWYVHWPKKKARGAAERAWNNIRPSPSDELVEQMIAKTKAWAASHDWTKENRRYVPNPATWLNGKGWLDDDPPPPVPENVTRLQAPNGRASTGGWSAYDYAAYAEELERQGR